MVARLEVASTRRALATNIHHALTFRQRLRGLVGRPQLEPQEALIFERARQVHTLGMRFPIDVVFCDRDWRVVHVVTGMRPGRVTRFVPRSHHVVELRAGAAADLQAGDLLVAS